MKELSIELKGITKVYQKKSKTYQILDTVNLQIKGNDIICLVGESGSGKTTLGKIIVGLIEPSTGEIRYNGKRADEMRASERNALRKSVQMIHQDPFASLNPVRNVYQTLSAPLLHHKVVRGEREAKHKALELLELVDLTPPQDFLYKYPHQLSGGQRQRVAIARALTVDPKFIVADEPVSMVDASIKASIINTLKRINEQFDVGFLFITHDLALARLFGQTGKLAVMYTGRIVEFGMTDEVIRHPQHPYTIALLSAVPEPDPKVTRSKTRVKLRSNDIPRLDQLPNGCHFHPRCPLSIAGKCDRIRPELNAVSTDHHVACHVEGAETKMMEMSASHV